MKGFISWLSGSLNFTGLRMPAVGFNSIIDIIIMSYLIYKILVFVARTRAWTPLKGISILALVYILSDMFKLYTIRWLVSNTLSVGLIAIIIIFQPEVRKALEQIGKGAIPKLVSGGADEEKEDVKSAAVDEIISACKEMSKARTGALIVIENDVPLGDIESSGVRVDAVVTSQLLISIFEDKMPLHDGAVIVSKYRISAAGCILPLTQKEIGLELGTRHRAAVGISEVSDANVVIVSNETGAISIAAGGRLYRNLSEDELRSMLYGVKKPPKRKLASFFKGR